MELRLICIRFYDLRKSAYLRGKWRYGNRPSRVVLVEGPKLQMQNKHLAVGPREVGRNKVLDAPERKFVRFLIQLMPLQCLNNLKHKFNK